MLKKCPVCGKRFEGSQRKRYCSPKCKKTLENSKRQSPAKRKPSAPFRMPSRGLHRPQGLNQEAGAYWERVAPTVLQRGHLNVLSEDAFIELCDLHSRLVAINQSIDETNPSLLQIDDKWDNVAGTETRSFKESALSDLKRKYSRQFLDYCKQFYLTPLSNRGNFNLGDTEEPDPFDAFMRAKNGD